MPTTAITRDEHDELIAAVREARAAAYGDSNDDEIAALQNALDLALQALGIEVPEGDDQSAGE